LLVDVPAVVGGPRFRPVVADTMAVVLVAALVEVEAVALLIDEEVWYFV
jgi:hypothetical protein